MKLIKGQIIVAVMLLTTLKLANDSIGSDELLIPLIGNILYGFKILSYFKKLKSVF